MSVIKFLYSRQRFGTDYRDVSPQDTKSAASIAEASVGKHLPVPCERFEQRDLFSIAKSRIVGGGNNSGQLRDLNGKLDKISKERDELDEKAKDFATEAVRRWADPNALIITSQEDSLRAHQSDAAAREEEDDLRNAEKDELEATGRLHCCLVPLRTWALENGAPEEGDDFTDAWIKAASQNNPLKSCRASLDAWVAHGGGTREAHRSWLKTVLELPSESAYKAACAAFNTSEAASYEVENYREWATEKRAEANKVVEQAIAECDCAIAAVTQGQEWLRFALIPLAESVAARQTENTLQLKLSEALQKLGSQKAALLQFDSKRLQAETEHGSEMLTLINKWGNAEQAVERKAHNAVLEKVRKEAKEEAAKRQAAMELFFAEQKENDKKVNNTMEAMWKKQEEIEVLKAVNSNLTKPSIKSTMQEVNTYSRPAPTKIIETIISNEGRLFAQSFFEAMMPAVQNFIDSQGLLEPWRLDVRQAIESWKPFATIAEGLQDRPDHGQAELEEFIEGMTHLLTEFAGNSLQPAMLMLRVNKKNPELAQTRAMEAFLGQWKKILVPLGKEFDMWLDVLKKQ